MDISTGNKIPIKKIIILLVIIVIVVIGLMLFFRDIIPYDSKTNVKVYYEDCSSGEVVGCELHLNENDLKYLLDEINRYGWRLSSDTIKEIFGERYVIESDDGTSIQINAKTYSNRKNRTYMFVWKSNYRYTKGTYMDADVLDILNRAKEVAFADND